MRRALRCGRRFLGISFVILMTGCGSGTPSSPSPTPSPSPSPSPAPSTPAQPPASPGPLALSAVSLSASSVYGQSQPAGTVTLTGAAPSSGVFVQLASSNSTVAQVPSTVMVPGGQTSAAFAITTSTVGNTSQVTITANYGGAVRTAALTVMPPQLEATYTVAGASKGSDGCVMGPETDQTDCTLDATASRGFIDRWIWTYWLSGAPIGFSNSSGRASLRIDTRCDFLQSAQGATDAAGNGYLQMTIELVVQDRIGTRSAPVRRAIRLYPNRMCGFAY